MSPYEPSHIPALIGMIGWLTIGTIIVIWIPRENEAVVRVISFWVSMGFFLSCCVILYHFDKSTSAFQYVCRIPVLRGYDLDISLGLDGVSFCFLFLTAYIMPLCVFASFNIQGDYKEFIVNALLVELFLVMSFCVTNILCFFIFFESILIPMFLMIGVSGSRSRRINASYYFFFYTLFGSFYLMIMLFYLYTFVGSFEYEVLFKVMLPEEHQKSLFFFLFVPFAIKVPVFPFHLWLPEAHVEAPTLGSVILASLLLKLGGYGFLRFTITMLPMGCVSYRWIVVSCCLLGIIYASLSAFRQTDLKRIIAYSSVAHMNLIVLGLFSFTHTGIEGAMFLMLGHGIVSTALFFCVGELYERHGTRALTLYSGLVQPMPLFSIFLFLFTLANMSFPGTSNFVGEFLILTGVHKQTTWVLLFAATGVVLSAVYSILLYNRISFGTLKNEYESLDDYVDLNRVAVYCFLGLTLSMFIFGTFSGLITQLTNPVIKDILANYLWKR